MSAADTNITGALVGSLIGAAVGGAAWVGVGYATGYELGILAVGVGIAVGIGAAMGAKGRAGNAGGIVAALVTILAIIVARYVVLQISIEQQIAMSRAEFGDEIPGPDHDEYWTAFIADRLIMEREQAGKTIEWPDRDDDEEWAAAAYPTDIWMEAQNSWSRLSLTEREQFCAAGTEMILTGDAERYRAFASVFGMLLANLHPMALIIMGIAATGAYKVAKNSRPLEGSSAQAEIDVTAEVMESTAPAPARAPARAMTSGFPNMPAAVPPTMHGGNSASVGAQAVPVTRAPAKPARPYKPAALDESQLPPQFRMKPPEDLPPIRVKRDERDAA